METFIKNIALKDSVPVNQQKEPLFSSVTPVMSGLSLKKELFTNTSERSLRVKIVNNRSGKMLSLRFLAMDAQE